MQNVHIYYPYIYMLQVWGVYSADNKLWTQLYIYHVSGQSRNDHFSHSDFGLVCDAWGRERNRLLGGKKKKKEKNKIK